MLDKVAGVLKKKRKNQRDILLRVAFVRFPLFFTVLPLWNRCLFRCYFLSIVCFLSVPFPTPAQTMFHFLIEKASLL